MELSKIEIPEGRTKEEIQQREQFIKDFYIKWNIENPEKCVYNNNLQEFIHVKFLSFQETVEKAARSYKSTLAVTHLSDVLQFAKIVNYTKPKIGNKKQSRFSDIIIMQHDKKGFGKIKLTVGVLRGKKENVQYCITAIEKTTIQPATYTQ